MEFINRDDELSFLRSKVPPSCRSSSLVILRAPSGFGKSTLTDRLLSELADQDTNIALVDPSIRIRSGDAKIYDGFYIQRCAADLTARASANRIPTLKDFLSQRRWITAAEKDPADAFRKYPNAEGLYTTAVEYIERFMGTGNFSEEKLLASDAKFAVQICREFVDHIADRGPMVSVVREAQHIDHESLKYFLVANKRGHDQHLVLEYTSFNGRFDPDHEKVLLRELEDHPNAYIYDLLQLNRDHLQELLRRSFAPDLELRSDFYLRWDGNLRAISELRYQVGVARRLSSSKEIERGLSHFSAQVAEHLGSLEPQQRLLLCLVVANVEALDRHSLLAVAGHLDPRSTISIRDQALGELISVHNFLETSREGIRVQNEDLATILEDYGPFKGLMAFAQKGLRDFYRALIEKGHFTSVAASVAVRQALRLCVITGDMIGVVTTARQLTEIVKHSNDQSIYIDAIIAALETGDLLEGEQRTLTDWAASLAYETADFGRAASVLLKLPQESLSPFERTMLACAQQEIGRHHAALELINGGSAIQTIDVRLASDLVRFLILRAGNNFAAAREHLADIAANPEYRSSALIGFAYRFAESVSEIPESSEAILRSVNAFQAAGLHRSKAYSELAGAVHFARQGDLRQAEALIARAEAFLTVEIRDQHLIRNNRVVIELYQPAPKFNDCIDELVAALETSRDDFSDVTILNNLSIVYRHAGRLTEAVDCAERVLSILKNPSFGDREVFWALAFNAMQVFKSTGQELRVEEVRAIPLTRGVQPTLYREYWNRRFETVEEDVNTTFSFMLERDYHPLFLSHWLIDREALEVLRQERPRSLPDTTSPY